jgi:hypothetical protein
MIKYLLPLLLLALIACQQKEVPPEKPWPVQPPVSPPAVVIDLQQLKQNLKMDFPLEKMGYKEKHFNTCTAGAGYSSNQNCYMTYLAIIHFRLRCRNSEDTVNEVAEDDIKAISNQPIKWTLKYKSGQAMTNDEGYGEVIQVYNKSPRYERLKLASNGETLYMRANEITSVVAPKPWCN